MRSVSQSACRYRAKEIVDAKVDIFLGPLCEPPCLNHFDKQVNFAIQPLQLYLVGIKELRCCIPQSFLASSWLLLVDRKIIILELLLLLSCGELRRVLLVNGNLV